MYRSPFVGPGGPKGTPDMKIKIDEVPASGLRLRWDEPAGSLDERLPAGAARQASTPAVRSKVHVNLHVARVERALAAVGRIETTVGLECARCLGPVETPLALDAAFLFVPPRSGAAVDEDPLGNLDLSGLPFELPADDLEVVDDAGPEIDLGAAAVDQVVLALPLKPLCQESCRGLCPHCGQDLNTRSCHCADDRADPRFAALKNLKLSR